MSFAFCDRLFIFWLLSLLNQRGWVVQQVIMKEVRLRHLFPLFASESAEALHCDVVQCRNGGICIDDEPDFSGHHTTRFTVEELLSLRTQLDRPAV